MLYTVRQLTTVGLVQNMYDNLIKTLLMESYGAHLREILHLVFYTHSFSVMSLGKNAQGIVGRPVTGVRCVAQ